MNDSHLMSFLTTEQIVNGNFECNTHPNLLKIYTSYGSVASCETANNSDAMIVFMIMLESKTADLDLFDY